jgi:hypothetical protein
MARPSKYKPEFCEQAQKLCMLGATNLDIAKFFGVAESTIDKWLAEKPEFSGAIKEGRVMADANVASRLYARAMGYTHKEEKLFHYQGEVIRAETIAHYPPETAAAIFWLKNRRPDLWRDKPTAEDDDTPPPVRVIIEQRSADADESDAGPVSADTE